MSSQIPSRRVAVHIRETWKKRYEQNDAMHKWDIYVAGFMEGYNYHKSLRINKSKRSMKHE